MAVPLVINSAAELDAEAMLDVVDGRRLELGAELLDAVATRRSEVLARLRTEEPVYGVNTGMGAASEVRLSEDAQSRQQNNLMLARAVGSAPWLNRAEVRAVVVVRLRTFLTGDAGVSPELCRRLLEVLNLDLHPAIPGTRIGTAGEIIPLAHLGGALADSGEFVNADGAVPAPQAWAAVGLSPYSFGPKEGVALIEGVPVTTALAILRLREARALAEQTVATVAADLVLVGASRDPFAEALSRSDAELNRILSAVRALAGPDEQPRALQAPLSFRVVGPALAQLLRSIAALEGAVARALEGVTDSPAFLEGRFVGTAGFDGFDLGAALDGLRLSTIHLAELSAARVHRLLNDQFTGLPRQLSDAPGLHAGMVAVHKRAVGVTHGLLAAARPASLGAIETSLGQEDVQSFSVAAAVACGEAIDGARDVLACELLAVTHGLRLAAQPPAVLRQHLAFLLEDVDAVLPSGTADRPFGKDIAILVKLLSTGWGQGVLGEPR